MFVNLSQAARQGVAVLMASTVVVLKHEPSTQVTILYQLILNLAWVIASGVSATLPSLVKIVSAVAPPRGD